MNDQPVSTTIEILGKPYPIRCKESELDSLQEAAAYLNSKMQEVQESGKAMNAERIAIISALNITHQFLQLNQQEQDAMAKINEKILSLHDRVETAIHQRIEAELVYTAE